MYIVTGVYYNSKRRFKPICSNNLLYALSINLWKGSVWQVTNGRRKLIRRVHN